MGQRADELEPRFVAPDEEDDLAGSTTAAREDIEATRAEMTTTIDAIQDRLDPEMLSEQAKDTAREVTDYAIREAKDAAREITEHAIEQAKDAVLEITGQATSAVREATLGKVETMARTATETAGGWRQSMFDTIKANPMPAALVGLGFGWMLLNRPDNSSTPRSPVFERYSAGAEHAQSTVAQVTDQMQEAGEQVVEQVQEQASRAQGFLQRQLEENPLLVGAVAVAIGGVLASTVRSTSREDAMLGPTRDRLMGTAKELTQDTLQKVTD